jgi:diaminopimelate epimerase
MQLEFLKMHGLGNDFVILEGRPNKGTNGKDALSLTHDQRCHIADRHFGIGCDQLIILETPQHKDADIFMRIFNPDGSQSGACGNATRCVASLMINETGKPQVLIETLRGLLPAQRLENGLITVDMGEALLNWQDIPLSHEMDSLRLPIGESGLDDPSAVGMGNPHCVFFTSDADTIDLADFGPRNEHHPLYPERTNVEVASIKSDGSIRLRVWERGAGITFACGSGACATMVAAHRRGLTPRKADIEMDGGILNMEWRESDGHVLMTGPVANSFNGVIEV